MSCRLGVSAKQIGRLVVGLPLESTATIDLHCAWPQLRQRTLNNCLVLVSDV